MSRALCAMRASRCVRLTAHAAAPPKRSLEAPALVGKHVNLIAENKACAAVGS